MSSKIYSAAIIGLNCEPVEVEAGVSKTSGQLNRFTIVGLPDAAVQEAKERVRWAIKNSKFHFPLRSITVNLAPADIRKEGPAYDLPIAISILVAYGHLPECIVDSKSLFVGELSLNGELRRINGSIAMAIMAKKHGINKIFLPPENAREASLIPGLQVYPTPSLHELTDHLLKKQELKEFKRTAQKEKRQTSLIDMAYVRGQEQVKRALEIAVSGSHNIFTLGTIYQV